MKKAIIIVVFVLVVTCSWGRAQELNGEFLKNTIINVETGLINLERFKDDYQSLPAKEKTNRQAEYIRNARNTFKQIEKDIKQLEENINSYSNKLKIEKSRQINEELTTLNSAVNEMAKKFNAERADITNGIVTHAPQLKTALSKIKSLINEMEKNTGNANGTLTQLPNKLTDEWTLFDYFPYAFLVIALLGVAATFFWFDKRMVKLERSASLQAQESAGVQQQVSQLDEKLVHFSQQVGKEFNAAIDQIWENIDKQQSSNSKLKAEIERLRVSNQPAGGRSSRGESPIIRSREEEVGGRGTGQSSVSSLPRIVSVSEYLNRSGAAAIRAKAVMFRPEVLQQADDDGPFVLMPDSGSHDLYKVIPGVPRFQSSQDYSHFAYFYDCDSPTSGELLIVEPALARYDSSMGQWALHRKGRLQIS